MTAPLRSGRRPADHGRVAGRGDLRLVEGRPRAARTSPRTRNRVLAVTAAACVAAALFALVAFHVVLTQNQFRLERLQARADVEQERYERLRLHVAELEAPSRVVAVAHERLGMVPPPGVTYLSAAGPASGRPAGDPAGAPETAGWSKVKRELASGP